MYELAEEMARSEDPVHQLALLARVRRRIRERCSALAYERWLASSLAGQLLQEPG